MIVVDVSFALALTAYYIASALTLGAELFSVAIAVFTVVILFAVTGVAFEITLITAGSAFEYGFLKSSGPQSLSEAEYKQQYEKQRHTRKDNYLILCKLHVFWSLLDFCICSSD